ncbi:hypothetical protein [Burkholderia sp. Ax-1719]|uniref:hypothetical protein n=1 Tax=Burkholderia sp. Ax-1719 TaxID=2608334 RepID=UPI001420A8E4|nr:hypothetical protein [Burkholderia sp. Ax-1719]NIE66841.1 hypothetical protein [Burkholderia sp. Ax-1719]
MKSHRPSARAINSARNLWVQLTAATDSINPPRALLNACATQESLAAFESEEKEIRPLALNTLKSAAELAVENGGWHAMNDLRMRLFLRAIAHNYPERRSRRGLGFQLRTKKDEIAILNDRYQHLLRSRATLLQAYSDIVDLLKTYRTLSPNLSDRLKRHEAMFDIKLLSEAGGTDEKK